MGNQVLVIFRDADRVPPYREALEAVGLHPLLTPVGEKVDVKIDGLLLMGGADVDPELYGQNRDPHTEEPDKALDQAELNALQNALANDIPVLAICRGMQLLNVAHGGSLIQHLDPPDRHRRRDGDRSAPVHSIAIRPGTQLADIAQAPTWGVNSRHHQAVEKVGNDLIVSATDPEDGIIEGLERTDKKFVLAVQWHPEDQIRRETAQLRLFQRFADAVQDSR